MIKNQCPKRKRLKDLQSKPKVPILKQGKKQLSLKNLSTKKHPKPDRLPIVNFYTQHDQVLIIGDSIDYKKLDITLPYCYINTIITK